MLQRFLTAEIEALKKQGRGHSYVLSIDARYGEGKTWFLERLTKQLRLDHPVAFIDAWVDDANEEPFVAIMSAIEDALAPFLSKDRKMADSLKAATRAALPIIGKVAVGALTKFGEKYVGSTVGSDISDEFSKARDEKPSSDRAHAAGTSAIDAGIANAGKAIESLVDKQAEAMLKSYRDRKGSRESFKENMINLTARIEKSASNYYQPLFVVVDELDRCRPNYAIKLLEEIKHFFDIPGVVFIVALHGSQLSKSINAIYGNEFDSQSYLQRFFSRRYEMRRLSVKELVVSLMDWWSYDDSRLERPRVQGGDNLPKEVSAAEFAGMFLEEFNATPRECFAIMDALRVFYLQWEHKTPIELSWALILIIFQYRNIEYRSDHLPESKYKMKIMMHSSQQGGYHPEFTWTDVPSFVRSFWQVQNIPLPDSSSSLTGEGINAYMRHRFQREFATEYANSYQDHNKPFPLWREYWNKLIELGRFTNTIPSLVE